MKKSIGSSDRGFILPLALIVFIVMTVVGLSIASLSFQRLANTHRNVHVANSLLVAESGIDLTLQELNVSDSFGGYATEQTLFDNTTQGCGTYETSVANGGTADEKVVTSIGRLHFPTCASPVKVTRTVRAVVSKAAPKIRYYAIHAGAGGLILNDHSSAEGTVYLNGKMILNDSSSVGTAEDPREVWAANDPCPLPVTGLGAIVCTEVEPITLAGSSTHIYGDVSANGQTTTSGMTDDGLVATSGVSNLPIPFIPHDREAQKNAVTNTMTSTDASCDGNEVKTWPANVHITGAARVELTNNCVILVEGDVWIDSAVWVDNNATIVTADSATTTPTVMIDGNPTYTAGTVTYASLIFNNSTTTGSGTNTNGVGLRFISYWSNSTCSPDCVSLTESEAGATNGYVSIVMNNNADANDTILVSKWALAILNQNSRVGSISGGRVILNDSSTATGNALYRNTGGGGGGSPPRWSVKLYQGIQ